MISAILALIGGIISGSYIPLLSPAVYLSAKLKKEIFLLSFFVYCIALSFEFELPNVYDIDPLIIFAVILPTILLLDAGLKGESRDIVGYAVIAISLVSLFIKEFFVIATVIYTFHRFSEDNPKRGLIVVASLIFLLILSLLLGEKLLNYQGSSSTQVTFISAITAITAAIIFWRKRVDKVDFSL